MRRGGNATATDWNDRGAGPRSHKGEGGAVSSAGIVSAQRAAVWRQRRGEMNARATSACAGYLLLILLSSHDCCSSAIVETIGEVMGRGMRERVLVVAVALMPATLLAVQRHQHRRRPAAAHVSELTNAVQHWPKGATSKCISRPAAGGADGKDAAGGGVEGGAHTGGGGRRRGRVVLPIKLLLMVLVR